MDQLRKLSYRQLACWLIQQTHFGECPSAFFLIRARQADPFYCMSADVQTKRKTALIASVTTQMEPIKMLFDQVCNGNSAGAVSAHEQMVFVGYVAVFDFGQLVVECLCNMNHSLIPQSFPLTPSLDNILILSDVISQRFYAHGLLFLESPIQAPATCSSHVPSTVKLLRLPWSRFGSERVTNTSRIV